jgi:hypothetical protein
MRALRQQDGNSGGVSDGSGGLHSGGSSAGPSSRSNSRAGSLRALPSSSAKPASGQRWAPVVDQSLDPLLKARVDELAEQAVAARLQGRLPSGGSASPALSSGEASEADMFAALTSGLSGDGGPSLESQRCAHARIVYNTLSSHTRHHPAVTSMLKPFLVIKAR